MITENATLLFSVNGQFASKNLTSAEKFSLGGPSGVRAYPTGEALGDYGYVIQAEARYLVPGLKLGPGDVTVSGFWDQGFVTICKNYVQVLCSVPVAQNVNKRGLSGYGVGASVGKDGNFVVRASAAWRNEENSPQADTSSRIPRVWVQAIKWF